MTPPSEPPEVELVISIDSLTSFFDHQTLKLFGYIKHRKVIILVDSGSTHNFIHHRISQDINYYIRAVNNFQIMIANGGSIKCGGCFNSFKFKTTPCIIAYVATFIMCKRFVLLNDKSLVLRIQYLY
jgi:hypothetical protein